MHIFLFLCQKNNQIHQIIWQKLLLFDGMRERTIFLISFSTFFQ